jgi:predicted TIM-barrel fold metal-dependent hydrolase
VTSWPRSRAITEEIMKDVPADERELILSGNAARVWNL